MLSPARGEKEKRETWADFRKVQSSMLGVNIDLRGNRIFEQPCMNISSSLLQSIRLVRKDFASVRRVTPRSGSGPVAATLMASNVEGSKGPEDNGFERSEMFTSNLVGTVKKYDAHIFAVTDKDVMSWPKNVEQPEVSMLAAKLGAALKQNKGNIPRNVSLVHMY